MTAKHYALGTPLTAVFGDHPRTLLLAAFLGEPDHDLNVTQLAEQTGLDRSTVYRHLPRLVELGLVEETSRVGNSSMEAIDRDDAIAEDVAALEWRLIERVAGTAE